MENLLNILVGLALGTGLATTFMDALRYPKFGNFALVAISAAGATAYLIQ